MNVVIPMPTDKKTGKKDAGGKKSAPVVKLEPKLHHDLKVLCAKLGETVQDYVKKHLEDAVSRDWLGAGLGKR